MKRIITILLLFSGQFLFANSGSGRISVSMLHSSDVRVMVDGYTYFPASQHQSEIMIYDIPSGYHELRIYGGKSYRGNRQGNRSRAIYSGTVFVRPGHHLDLILNRFGRVFFDEFPLSGIYGQPWGNVGSQDPWNNGNCRSMSGAAFGQLKASLTKIAFEDTRLSALRQGIRGNFLELSQVRELMDLFAFEDNKMEVARECYSLTTDRKQYYLLQDAFSFNSNKEAFLNIMQ